MLSERSDFFLIYEHFLKTDLSFQHINICIYLQTNPHLLSLLLYQLKNSKWTTIFPHK
jgi:hypothetical protein